MNQTTSQPIKKREYVGSAPFGLHFLDITIIGISIMQATMQKKTTGIKKLTELKMCSHVLLEHSL